jgi:hypothetical protein
MKPSKKPANQKSFTVSRRCEGMARAETVSEKKPHGSFWLQGQKK